MGGCALVGESLLNIRGGGKLRYAGVVCALVILVSQSAKALGLHPETNALACIPEGAQSI